MKNKKQCTSPQLLRERILEMKADNQTPESYDRPLKPTDKDRLAWYNLVESSPPNVRAVARRFFPWQLYRLKDSGHIVTIDSFCEAPDGSVTLNVDVTGQYNKVWFDRQVFGVKPEDLESCDPPPPGSEVGTVLTGPEEIEVFCDAIRHVLSRRQTGSVTLRE
jgi:hypothetical protein